MADTRRERIVEAFAQKMSATRCAVLDGDSDLPARAFWDNQEEAELTQYNSTRITLPIPVEYLAKVDSSTYANHSKQANAMLGELITDALSGDRSLGGLCQSIRYRSSEFDYPEAGEQEIAVAAVFEIVYEIVSGDPLA